MSAKQTKSSGSENEDQTPSADALDERPLTATPSDSDSSDAAVEPEPGVERTADTTTDVGEKTSTPEPEDTVLRDDEPDVAEIETEADAKAGQPEGEDLSDTVQDVDEERPTDDGSVLKDEDEQLTDAVEETADEAPSDETVVEPEPEPQPQDRIVERVVETRSVFVPAIFGGLAAGVIGFAAASSGQFSGFFSEEAAPAAEAEVSAEEVAALRDQIAALEVRLAEPAEPAPAPDLSGIEAQIADGLARQLEAFTAADAALTARLDEIAAQLTVLEQSPVEASLSEEAIAAYEAELAAVQAALTEQRAEVEAMIADAAQMEAAATESARQAQAQAASTRLFVALETGESFVAEVTELQSLGVTVPDALVASSEGVTPLGTLQAEFPDLARTALAAARNETAGSPGFSGFLQRQLGARSVTPRDGDDPDAVLSRAEAALTQGDVAEALVQLEGLPDVAKAPLSGWSDAAIARQTALIAAEDLAQSLTHN